MTNITTRKPSVKLVHGKATTTSLKIADVFGKRHRDVLRAIANLECSPEFRERNFALSSIEINMPNGGARTQPMYTITRDGFAFLASGFTGKEAAQWKEKFIEAFNKLEQAALEKAANKRLPKPAAAKPALPAPNDAISSELQAAIDKRAFDLSHAAYAHYRHRMATDVLVKSRHTRPGDWTPEECRIEALECIELASCMMETFAKSLRNRGIELGRMVGADFDLAAKRFRPKDHSLGELS